MKQSYPLIIIFCLITANLQAQQTLTEKSETLQDHSRSVIKQRSYEFLRTFNPSADLIAPAEKEMNSKILQNKQKRKDPEKGTEELRLTYETMVASDGTERSFLAESFAQSMLNELIKWGMELPAEDIYTAQYVIKYVLGVPRFNRRELDVDNHNQMDTELSSLISKYPDNDAQDQQIDGRVIGVFTNQSNAYFESFVASNIAQLEKSNGNKIETNSLSNMNCGEKYKYLKEQGIMH
jgi:hypothetical protein